MTNLEGALREIREALLAYQNGIDYVLRQAAVKNHHLRERGRSALAKLDAILDAVPEALHDDKLRIGDYWVYECLHLLSDIAAAKQPSGCATKEKNDE